MRAYLADSAVSLVLALAIFLSVCSLRLRYESLAERIRYAECRIEAEELAIEILERGASALEKRACALEDSRFACGTRPSSSSCSIPLYLPSGESVAKVELVVECDG